jgi:hypothetical protein
MTKEFCDVCKHVVFDIEKHVNTADHKRHLRGPAYRQPSDSRIYVKRGVKRHYGMVILKLKGDSDEANNY